MDSRSKEDYAAECDEYHDMAKLYRGDDLEEILDRTFDVYEITIDIASNFKQNYKYYIDQETMTKNRRQSMSVSYTE